MINGGDRKSIQDVEKQKRLGAEARSRDPDTRASVVGLHPDAFLECSWSVPGVFLYIRVAF